MRLRQLCIALRAMPPIVPLLLLFLVILGIYITDRGDAMVSEMVRAVFYAVLTVTGIGPAAKHIQRVGGSPTGSGADGQDA